MANSSSVSCYPKGCWRCFLSASYPLYSELFFCFKTDLKQDAAPYSTGLTILKFTRESNQYPPQHYFFQFCLFRNHCQSPSICIALKKPYSFCSYLNALLCSANPSKSSQASRFPNLHEIFKAFIMASILFVA